jgi:hypothetical protein
VAKITAARPRRKENALPPAQPRQRRPATSLRPTICSPRTTGASTRCASNSMRRTRRPRSTVSGRERSRRGRGRRARRIGGCRPRSTRCRRLRMEVHVQPWRSVMPDPADPAGIPPPTPEMLALLRRWLLRGYQPGTQLETTPAERAEAARVASAQRMREAVRPSFGRHEGPITKVISKYPGHVLQGIWEDLTNPPDPRIDPEAAAGYGLRLALGTLCRH